MGLRDALFGRKRPKASLTDRLGAVASAEIAMQTELAMAASGRAGIAVRNVDSNAFRQARDTVQRMLELAGRDLGSVTDVSTDEYGYSWIVVSDPDFPDLAACMQISATTLAEEGWRDSLLCAVYPFRDTSGQPLHLVYAFKRGTFYAFAPRSGNTRDLALELRVHAVLERELPLEADLQYRYPVWGTPV